MLDIKERPTAKGKAAGREFDQASGLINSEHKPHPAPAQDTCRDNWMSVGAISVSIIAGMRVTDSGATA